MPRLTVRRTHATITAPGFGITIRFGGPWYAPGTLREMGVRATWFGPVVIETY